MIESCEGIRFCNVLDLMPDECAVIIRSGPPRYAEKITMDPKTFQRFKFEAIKWIRKRPNPEDRFWRFETYDQDGIWSLDIEDRLIESRKTRSEKEQEMKERMELRAHAKRLGIEWHD